MAQAQKTRFKLKALFIPFRNQSLKLGAFKLGSSLHCLTGSPLAARKVVWAVFRPWRGDATQGAAEEQREADERRYTSQRGVRAPREPRDPPGGKAVPIGA